MRAAPGAIERVEIDAKTLEPRFKIIGEDNWNTGKVKGICGSAIIDAVAEMFRVGILDSRGRFKRGVKSDRIIETDKGAAYILAWAAGDIHRTRHPHHFAGCARHSTSQGSALRRRPHTAARDRHRDAR